jgi:hypothetical protein
MVLYNYNKEKGEEIMANDFWDSEVLIGTHEESEKKHYDVSHCILKGKDYISIAEKQLTKEGWKFRKNRTMPLAVFKEAQNIVSDAGL